MIPTNFALNIFSRSAAGTERKRTTNSGDSSSNAGNAENADNTESNAKNGATQQGPASSNTENGTGNKVESRTNANPPPNLEEIPVDNPPTNPQSNSDTTA